MAGEEKRKRNWKKEKILKKGCSQLRKLDCCQQLEEVETSIKSLKLPLTFWQQVKHQFGFRKCQNIFVPGELASFRVDHHHHHHGQLRCHGPRRQAFKQRQVDHVDQAGQIEICHMRKWTTFCYRRRWRLCSWWCSPPRCWPRSWPWALCCTRGATWETPGTSWTSLSSHPGEWVSSISWEALFVDKSFSY